MGYFRRRTRLPGEPLIDSSANLGPGVKIWHWSQIREEASVGKNTSVGQSVYVGPGVLIGANCKIQNGAQLYEPAIIHDGVFIGPNTVLTNDKVPRAVITSGTEPKSEADWNKTRVEIHTGASLGANVVCVAPITIGEWALVGAGSTVTGDVLPHAIVAGNPARQIGWVGRGGSRLAYRSGHYVCPDTGDTFVVSGSGALRALR